MRWWAFALVAFVGIVIETSLRRVFLLGDVSPALLVCVAVFVSLFAPKRTALWACWMLGLMMDLVTTYSVGRDGTLHLIGPQALAFTALAAAVIWVRASVFRQRVLTIAVLTLVGALIVGVVAISIAAIRSWYPQASQIAYFRGGSAWSELLHSLGVAAYSAVIALPLGWLLLASLPLWRFETFGHRYAMR